MLHVYIRVQVSVACVYKGACECILQVSVACVYKGACECCMYI